MANTTNLLIDLLDMNLLKDLLPERHSETSFNLLLEDGNDLLLETGGLILLEKNTV